MINFFSILLFYLAISFTQTIPSYEYSDWNVLQDQDIWIGWTNYKDFDWGKARITFDYSSDQVSSVLDDHANYTNIFKRMIKCEVNKDGVVYIVLDMPFPISHRDYVVYYKQFSEKGHKIYQFFSTSHEDFPIDPYNVRLPRATGEWRLIPIDKNTTELIYTWNGELLGDFPDFALTRAWTEQGDEVMNWLRESLNKIEEGK